MITKRLMVLSVFLMVVLSLLNINVTSSSPGTYPAIYVEPATVKDKTLTPGENFTVSIKTDYAESNVTAWQLTMSYDPNVLNGVNVTNGDLISTDKDPTATFIPGSFNNTEGTLSLTAAFFFYIFPPPAVTSGPGTLANVTFTVVDYGVSDILLGNETQLIGWNSTASKEYFIIDAEVEPDHIDHGYFSNKIAGDVDGDRDVDCGDLYMFSKKYDTEEDDPNYDLHCDLDDDGDVDSDDVILFSEEYGQSV